MKKMIFPIVLICAATMLGGCSDDTEETETTTLDVSQLIGEWLNSDSTLPEMVTIYEKGTYHKYAMGSGITLDYTDNYEIDGDRLILDYSEMGITFTYTVTFENEDKMTWYNAGTGEKISTYTRKPE